VAAARELHRERPLDALVVIRGGGAVTDLAWLNDLNFARALATFPAPVITGLGHARDDTLPDEVACVRTDTPSKAAALIVRTVAGAAAQAQEDARSVRAHAARVLVDADAASAWAIDRARAAAERHTQAAGADVDALMRQALGLTPARTLARGYALVRGEDGQPVTRAAGVRAGQALILEFTDGSVRTQVAASGE
jgi:exodeoxyribonuclease VII large subunit